MHIFLNLSLNFKCDKVELIPLNDYTELAEHIEYLRENPHIIAKSVISGYNRVTELYNFDTCVMKLKKYINSLINLNKEI